jgi:DNA mismatch repair protein MutS2
MARDGNGIINGAMLFDTNEIRPLYKLKIGKPGSSFAFEIARKIGLDENLLNRAKKGSGRKQTDFDMQLQQLETEKYEVDETKKELQVADEILSDTIAKYTKLYDELQAEKKELIWEAKIEAKQILKESNKLIEQTIREIKESQAEKSRTINVRQKVAQRLSEMEELEEKKN